jgi:hypothetical protein
MAVAMKVMAVAIVLLTLAVGALGYKVLTLEDAPVVVRQVSDTSRSLSQYSQEQEQRQREAQLKSKSRGITKTDLSRPRRVCDVWRQALSIPLDCVFSLCLRHRLL